MQRQWHGKQGVKQHSCFDIYQLAILAPKYRLHSRSSRDLIEHIVTSLTAMSIVYLWSRPEQQQSVNIAKPGQYIATKDFVKP